MGKYLELFRSEVGDLTEKTKLENKPYVAYSTKLGKVTYTVVPKPVTGPADNEIWYTTTDNKIYDLGTIVTMLSSMGATYNGPKVASNEFDTERQMYVMKFEGDVTVLGDINLGTMIADGPFFITDSSYRLECNVETIVLSNSITRIGERAFNGCSKLTSITIPNSVTSIGDDAFRGCSSLTSITIPNSVTSIGNCAFIDCSSLTSITIPNSVMSIGDFAFQKCESLTSITIPNSVMSIGGWAFSGCSSLTSITIPNGVTSIGWNAFENCSSLTSINIPNNVTRIEGHTFENCSSLTSITIPNSVTHIGYQAFYGCSSLTSIIFQGSMEEWNNIYKDARWNDGVQATHIQCSDGQVAL